MKKLIKTLFTSIIFAYKNIFHWVFSKILISISSYLIGILFSLPFLIIAFVIIYFSPLELSNFFAGGQYLLNDAINNQFWFILVLIFFIFTIISLLIGISYKRFLLAKLNLKYIEGKKLGYKKNNYFNFKLFIKYFKINLIFLLVILGFSLIFIIVLSIIIFAFGGIYKLQILLSSGGNTLFSVITLILAITLLLALIYTIYRIYFSYFILLENKDYSALKSIKKSFKKTKSFSKLVKLIGVFVIFFILFLPVNYLGQYISYNSNNLIKYIGLKNKVLSEKTKNKVTQNEFYIYKALDIEYGKLSNKELLEKYNKNRIIEIIFFVIHFILIFGILDLVIANFYKKEIK